MDNYSKARRVIRQITELNDVLLKKKKVTKFCEILSRHNQLELFYDWVINGYIPNEYEILQDWPDNDQSYWYSLIYTI